MSRARSAMQEKSTAIHQKAAIERAQALRDERGSEKRQKTVYLPARFLDHSRMK